MPRWHVAGTRFHMAQTSALSGVDAAWLHTELPTNRMIIAGFFQLADHVTRDAIAATVEPRLARFPRFMDRVVDRGGRARPRWERDPTFDVSRHIVTATVPAPGDEAALQRALSKLASEPLDKAHPLWQLHVFEDYAGGTIVFSRIHHCVADGFALMNVLLSLCDADERHILDAPIAPHRRLHDDWHAVLEHPSRAPDLLRALSSYGASLLRLLLLPADPHTPLRGKLVTEKRIGWTRPLALQEVKAIGHAAGASVNDVLMAIVAGALRTYLQRNGCELLHDVHAMVPVNLRGPDETTLLGNRFGLVVPALPVSLSRPLERLAEMHRRMDALKLSREARVGLAIVHAMGFLPRALEMPGVLFFATKSSVVLTNVPGPRARLLLAGSRIERTMFWVPQSGSIGVGVSIMSYAGEVTIGVMSDALRVPDPHSLIDAIESEFETLRTVLQGNAVNTRAEVQCRT